MFLRGEVTDNQDPMKRGRVRVFIWGVHKEKDDNLPWAEVMGDTTDPLHQGEGKKPKEMPIGCTVWVEFEQGDLNCPVVVGVFVGHEAGNDMSAADPSNSDWEMASDGEEGKGAGEMLGGIIGGMIGGPFGSTIGKIFGGIIDGKDPMQAVLGGVAGAIGIPGIKLPDIPGSISGGVGNIPGFGSLPGIGNPSDPTPIPPNPGNPSNAPTTGGGSGTPKWTVNRGVLKMGSWSRTVSQQGLKIHGPMIIQKAKAAGIDPAIMLAMANIESGFVATAQNGAYGGLFAINKDKHKNWSNPQYNTDEAIRIYKSNERIWKSKVGDSFSAGKAYLLHQQGSGGGPALYKGGSKKAGDVLNRFNYGVSKKTGKKITGYDVVRMNGGDVNMTAREFANFWIHKADALTEYYRGYLGSNNQQAPNSPQRNESQGTSSTPKASSVGIKAAKHAIRHKTKTMNGNCAYYVNNCFGSQGYRANGHAVVVAENLHKLNPGKFKMIPYSSSYVPVIGDVMSMPADYGANKTRQLEKYPHILKQYGYLPGHVAIYTGPELGWVSDGPQGRFGNTGAANSTYYKAIIGGHSKVTIVRPI